MHKQVEKRKRKVYGKEVTRFVKAVEKIAAQGCDYKDSKEDRCANKFPLRLWCGPCLANRAITELKAQ
jgi:hypothetical protein